jgi:L-ribulose-5-phosphate 3-epimerase UlaE
MTTDEKKAIERLKKAIMHAHSLGIRLAGMDGDLLYATAEAFAQGKKIAECCPSHVKCGGNYGAVACANQISLSGTGLLDNKCYEDSGGW